MQVLTTTKLNVQVNIIVATSILEEGLDVQTCNLVIRFDPSPTVCSFIQSRGRARMKNSDYLLIVKRYSSFFTILSIIIAVVLTHVLIIKLYIVKVKFP